MGHSFDGTLFHRRVSLTMCLLSLITLLMCIRSTHTFNINILNVRRMEGQGGSHFGQSIAFDAKTNSLLVGAPKEEHNVQGEMLEPGVVRSCSLASQGPQLDCSKIIRNFPQFYKDPHSTKHESFGSSISISDSGKAMVCAPLWEDTAYLKANYVFMPGRCALFHPDAKGTASGKEEKVAPYYHPRISAKNYQGPNKEAFHGMAAFGFSSDTIGNATFVMGAPGLSVFEGGIYIKDYDQYMMSETVPKKFKDTLLARTAYGYLGYAVKIGKFDDKYIRVAAGAPNLDSIGMVRLYKWVNKELLYHYQDLHGEETWSYFGSVLSTVDTDKDGYDELLVGAPFYTDTSSKSFDVGKVYVYKRGSTEDDLELQMTLHGSGEKYSRFGSAIQGIGDINLDSYPDVAIGSPGENEDTGCIYVYLGGPRGLVAKYSQRICAKEMEDHGNRPLALFGASLSGAITQRRSPYPVFAASSFPTDNVIVFGTRTIVRVNATIEATPDPIRLDKECDFDPTAEPCSTFKVCYKQEMLGVATTQLDFDIKIEVDGQRRHGVHQRVQFKDSAGDLVDNLVDKKVFGLKDNGFCQNFQLITNKDQLKEDRFTPIEFKVTMEIDSSRLDPKSRAFANLPILDPTTPNTFSNIVSISNDCGSNNVCDVDLAVTGTIRYSHKEDWPYVVIGHTKEIRVALTVSNSEETSYGTRVTVELNQPLRYRSETLKHCKAESSVDSNTVIVCNYYLPLTQDSPIDIELAFDATRAALDQKTITATARATPINQLYSHEKNPDDNEKKLTTAVFIVADVNMFGSSSPSEVTIKNAKKIDLSAQEPITKEFTTAEDVINPMVLNHKYQMINVGPSFLPKTNVYLSLPVYLPDATQLISGVSVQLTAGDQQPAVNCTDIVDKIEGGIHSVVTTSATEAPTSTKGHVTTDGGQGLITTTLWSPGGIPTKRKRRKRAAGNHSIDDDDSDDADFSKTYVMTCDSSPEYCVIFRCGLESDTPSGGHITFNVTMEVDRDNVPIPEDFTSFYMQLKTLVQQPPHILFKPWDTESWEQASARTSTTFHLVESGGEIQIWIIIVSVVCGLLFILLIALVGWKLGFFKRKKHADMEEWKRKSVRMSRAPATLTP